jgi:hypothetical protein
MMPRSTLLRIESDQHWRGLVEAHLQTSRWSLGRPQTPQGSKEKAREKKKKKKAVP